LRGKLAGPPAPKKKKPCKQHTAAMATAAVLVLTLLCAPQPVAGPLPANCSMVADDTAMAGGTVVPAARTVGDCCRACSGRCRQWSFTAGVCAVNTTGRAYLHPGSSMGTIEETPCQQALARLCPAIDENCLVCAGQRQRALRAAMCVQNDIVQYCRGVMVATPTPTPTPPTFDPSQKNV
jgi:hypothetical protein